MNEDPQEFDTYRTKCGRGRVTYRSEWSPSMPWVTYWDGTAGRHFSTFDEVFRYFKERHDAHLEC